MNYYNEFEPFATEWLKELIKDGLIPEGEVDTRSIVDVEPSDLKDFTQCHSDQCGQDHRPVSRSQSQESRKGQTMSDISGLSGSILSESANLQSYLESKLLPLSDRDGLIPFKKTWKQKTTPAQRRYCQLQVSALSIKGIGSGSLPVKSWTTPSARDYKDTAGQATTGEGGRIRIDQVPREAFQLIGVTIPRVASLWGTPVANPANGTPEAFLARKRKAVDRGSKMGISLSDIQMQAKSVLWPTVTTQDNSQLAGQYSKTNGTTLGGAVRQCNLKTEKSAPSQLNPRFSLWLMGYPIEWAYCAERVTPSSRRSRQKS
jgi:hypothetical protein